MKKIVGLLLGLLVCMTVIPAFARETEWECENCGAYNAGDFNFCGICGSKRPMEDWECENCGTVNSYKNNFCGNCGQKKGIIYKNQGEDSDQQTSSKKWIFGKQMLYARGFIYVAGNDGIYRINTRNEYECILGEDAFTDAFFSVGDKIYFVKYTCGYSREAWLYQYDSTENEVSALCQAGFYGQIVGADDDKVYFLQDAEQEGGWGNLLIACNIETGEKTVLAEEVGEACFWNGTVLYTGWAGDISPVKIYRMDKEGNTELLTERGSQNLYVDGENAYYIAYTMADTALWNQASIYKMTEDGSAHLADLSGDYVTPSFCGKAKDNLIVACAQRAERHYYNIAADGQLYEMELPEGADTIQVFHDEYENTYYYANDEIFYWKGAGYKSAAEVPADVSVIGVMGGYVFYYVYDYTDSAAKNPGLFQVSSR